MAVAEDLKDLPLQLRCLNFEAIPMAVAEDLRPSALWWLKFECNISNSYEVTAEVTTKAET